MKTFWTAVLGLALAAGIGLVAFADDDDYPRRGPGWRGGADWMGPGMMGGWGGGPGMMGWGGGGGFGMMGGGFGMMGGGMMGQAMLYWGQENGLSREQLGKIEQLQLETSRAMRDTMFANRERMISMREAMHKFPVDEKAAAEQFKTMNSVHESMFKLHLGTMAKAQQIFGKEKWEEMIEDFNSWGWGGPGGRGMMRNR